MLQYCFQVYLMLHLIYQFNNESVDASNILPNIRQKYGTTEIVEADNLLPDIAEENGTTEAVNSINILPAILEENGSTVVDTSNISSGTVQESGTTKVVQASNILPDIAQENGITELVDASNILPGISQENKTPVVGVSNFLSHILKGNVTTEITPVSNISPNNAPEIETAEIIGASKMAQENGATKLSDASNILRDIAQENRTAEAVEASHILPKQNFEYLPRSCYDLQKLGGVCRDKNYKIIESDPQSDIKNIFEITFNDTKYLPARALFGFSLQFLILDDSDVTVDENVFKGIVYLKEFIVQQSNIKVIPDFRTIKDTIQTIDIRSSPLTSLEGKNLQNLTIVKYLFFENNCIRFIHPDVFKGTKNVIYLYLSNNLLTSIPPNLLNPMKKLKRFIADHNNLLHVANLFSITHPQAIVLNSNNITDVESVLYFDMKNVETFDISENPIINLTLDSFNGKINNVEHLNLSHCKLQNLTWEYFYDLKGLTELDLSYNLIEDISDRFTERYDDVADVKLVSFSLTGNKLTSLRNILNYKEIRKISLSVNQIHYLTDEDFRFVQGVYFLQLQENEIRRIATDTFKPIRISLRYLELNSNKIKSLNGSISYLSQLRKLQLGDNLIESFASDEFTGLDELSELYLQHNRIKDLWQFQQLHNLQYLDITHNNIEVIMSDQVPKMLKRIYLAGNTLKCDCRLQPFLLRLHTEDSFETDINICTRYSHKSSNCPDVCSCGCTNFGDDYFMSLDCSSKSLSVVPQFLRDGFAVDGSNETITFTGHSLLVMKQNIYPLLDLEDRVLGINLENNSLGSLEGIQLPPNLLQLYLANNTLRKLPDSILKNQVNLKIVSLSGNPWNCNCDALKFKRWLTSPLRHLTVQDIEQVRCRADGREESNLNGKVIGTLTDHDLCPKEVDFIVLVSISVLTAVILCLATIIAYRKYELNAKVLLHSHGFTFVKEKDLDYEKVFDAFLSFCHQDDTFVIDEIISVIEERDPNIRLCIHNRHFTAGENIYDNIIWAVQNSKRTVLILSENFLDSEWCLMEFRTAHMQAMENRIHRIIVIKVGDLPKEIDPAINVYLDTTTYLTWGEKNFWNKLLYVLPSGSRARHRLEEV